MPFESLTDAGAFHGPIGEPKNLVSAYEEKDYLQNRPIAKTPREIRLEGHLTTAIRSLQNHGVQYKDFIERCEELLREK